MTIRFRCECGRVLMASDDQSGREGQCPACGEIVTIPQAEVLDRKESEQDSSEKEFEDEAAEGEASMGIEELDDMERELEEKAENQHERKSWLRSPRFAMLASIVVVVIVALVVFMIIRREKEPREELVIIKKIEPLAKSEEETPAPPVGSRLEEGEEPPQFKEAEPIVSEVAEGESVEEVSPETPVVTETEVVSDEEVKEEKKIVASTMEETPPTITLPPIGAYTINVASFRKRQSAERYVEELKKMGIEAFNWEVNLPEKGKWYRVSVGDFSSREEAEDYANDLKAKGISDIFITQVSGTS
ncbi:MAG: hypothetical protein AMJ92_06645 [candidate division Zixibacteria bacterium SM23_81]|nr:MAG: hypothetical protein AMJ92_06645 [candidate division Zixibacteria bacterium SM23_81]